MTARSLVRLALAFLVAGMAAGAASLAPDERGRERIRGDDDPIIVPASVAVPEYAHPRFDDPETTGSIERKPARASQVCNRLAFHPERPPEDQFREAC